MVQRQAGRLGAGLQTQKMLQSWSAEAGGPSKIVCGVGCRLGPGRTAGRTQSRRGMCSKSLCELAAKLGLEPRS